MSTSTLFQFPRAQFSARIDAAAGIIRDVAVITIGPALGHGVMVDKTTLEQVKRCAEGYSGGLKVKLNHSGGVDAIVGVLRNFRLQSEKLVADLHLLQTAQKRDYVLELAATIPDGFGLSIAFSGVSEEVSGVRYARCDEIYSCDLVSEPAANPDGLFSRRLDEWAKGKDQPEPTGPARCIPNPTMENEILSQIGKLIDEKLAAQSAAFDAKISEIVKANASAFAKIEEVSRASADAADKAALAAVKEFAKTLGQPAGAAAAPSAPATQPAPAKKFEELVKQHPEYSKSRKAAISATIAKNPAEYAAYNQRVRNGEIVMF